MIDRLTGALTLSDARIERGLTRSAFMSSPMGAQARCDDMRTGWMHVYLEPQTLGSLVFYVDLTFEAERLDGYRLWLADPRYGTSSDDYSEEKQLARRDAHDAWLVSTLGPGRREPSPHGPELRYSFPWGEAYSTFDARGGSSPIGVRLRRDALLAMSLDGSEDAAVGDPSRYSQAP